MAEYQNRSEASAERYAAITPSNSTDLPFLTRMIIIAEGGTLAVHDKAGASHTLTLPPGAFPIVVRRVLEASTATGITAVY